MLGGAPRSAAASSVAPLASVLEPTPESPRETTLVHEAPTATNTERPAELDPDLYADETETDRKFFDLAPYRDPASSSRVPAPLAQPPTVQAFAPIKVGSDHDVEEPTESRNAVSDDVLRRIREGSKTVPPPVPEEETQQLEMTPELRAKIEAQYAARPVPPAPMPARPPMQSEMDSIPPPTKRLDK